MKIFSKVLVLVLVSFTLSRAESASIGVCQGQQFEVVRETIDADADMARLFSAGFQTIEFDFDDAWEEPLIRASATVMYSAVPCMIEFRLESYDPPALGCPVYQAIKNRVDCPDLCKSCGLILDAGKD